jgi:hypothetical protein
VSIDMLAPQTIHRIAIKNRGDCCSDRGLPLVVEVADEDRRFIEVGRRTMVFETWTIELHPRRARYVRLRAQATTILHFEDVQIS